MQGGRDKSTITSEYFNIFLKYFTGQLKISKDIEVLNEIINHFDQSNILELSIKQQ